MNHNHISFYFPFLNAFSRFGKVDFTSGQSSDYSPFGVQLSGRNFVKNGAKEGRFGFQGQEEDDEIKGEGNSLNYTFRMHDPRLGRLFAIDPLSKDFPWNSPHAFGENRLLDAIELEGKEALLTIFTTQPNGEIYIDIMADYTVENNASVALRNTIIVDGVNLRTTYGTLGAKVLTDNFKNVRFDNTGRLVMETPNGETSALGSKRVVTGSNGMPVEQLNDFVYKAKTTEIGPIDFHIPFNAERYGSTMDLPINLNVPKNADVGSVSMNVSLLDFSVANSSDIIVNGTNVGTLNGTASSTTPVTGTYTLAPGDNVQVNTNAAPPGDLDDFEVSGGIDYKITP